MKWLIPLSNGQRKMNSRQRRKKKCADDRNASESSPSPPASELSRATERDTYVYQEKAPAKPPESPVIKTAFNREKTMKVIKEKEEENLHTAEWFYFDLPRQEAIEILKEKGRNKAFLVRENGQEDSAYELCMKNEGCIFILPISYVLEKYYFKKWIVKVDYGS